MPLLSQEELPLKISTKLGPDVLLLTGFSGTEGISTPFSYNMELVSTQMIHPKELLRTPATLTLPLPGGKERKIHGLVGRFSQTGKQQTEKDTQIIYQAELIPWLGFLGLSRDSRTFQEMSVLDIMKKVFQEQGFSDFEFRCTKNYPKREYCVQYQETFLTFISRLMEEEGIFYFFKQDGTKHILIVADDKSVIEPAPDGATVRFAGQIAREDVITALHGERAPFSGKVTLRDYDPLQPSLSLEVSLSGKGEGEVFQYPGGFTKIEQGERYARLHLEAEEALRQTVRGEGNVRTLQAGYRFEVKDHFNPALNQSYMLLRVLQSTQASGGGELDTYTSFVAIPHKVQYRPSRQTPKPVMRGPQTAVVVGPKGEEIWVDKYGRVKIQFHWDRRGKKDENSSCWVRVASSWAGKNWGAIQIPRIGQEVLVDFLEGDPDRPIIVGSVYNAEQMPPYALPANQTQSGLKTRSTKGGGAENFNELRFEDKKGSEEIYLHAEKDLNAVIEDNETRKVGFQKKDKGDQSVEIFNNQTLKVGAGAAQAADGSQSVEIHNDQTLKVGTGGPQASSGSQTIEIYKDQSTTLKQGNQSTEIKMGNQTTVLGQGNQELNIKMGNQTIKLGMGNRSIKLDLGKITEEAMQAIELKVGQSSIKIDQTGVTIKGMMVKIEGQVMTEVKSPMTQVSGNAMLTLKGGITMIN